MLAVTGVRFRQAGKIYCFDPADCPSDREIVSLKP